MHLWYELISKLDDFHPQDAYTPRKVELDVANGVHHTPIVAVSDFVAKRRATCLRGGGGRTRGISKCRCMHVDEVRAEHVKLSWAVPEDDGGTPITSYLVRYMDIDSGEWVTACTTSTPSATAQGLKPGHLYMFEISAINKEGQSEPLFTGDPILAENPYSKLLRQ